MKNEKIEKEFIDENGDENKIIIEPTSVYQLNMGKVNYRIAKEMKPVKMKKFYKNPFISDVGIKSGGFAKVFFLSLLLAIAVVIVLYLTFKY